ncbi:MAG: acyl-CoA dehydrogenase family protein [Alphaproteobacteria bacterium]
MEPSLTANEQALVERATAFARDEVAPNAAAWETGKVVPRDTLAAACRAGFAGLLVDEAQGGAGIGAVAVGRVLEELAAADLAFAFAVVVHANLAGNIARNGSPAQKAKYLPAMLAGETIGAFLLTEPGAGSDATAIATRASQHGDGWRLDGAKAWCTNAATADVLSVYAQSGDKARDIVCLLVDADHDGVTREPTYATLGCHAMGTAGFSFGNCRLGPEALFIQAPRAFAAAMGGIDIARAVLAAMCCGLLRTSLEVALRYGASRHAFGQPIGDFQGWQWQLADVETDLAAARLLAYDALSTMQAGAPATLACAHAKKFATRAAMTGVTQCMQAIGANGFRHDLPLARALAAAKMAAFLDGTTEIQNVVISRDQRRRADILAGASA